MRLTLPTQAAVNRSVPYRAVLVETSLGHDRLSTAVFLDGIGGQYGMSLGDPASFRHSPEKKGRQQ
jgi:hypothetical protein